MTNIRKLAIQIYRMQNRDKIMAALPVVLSMLYPESESASVEEAKREGGKEA